MADYGKTSEINRDHYRSRFGSGSYLLLLLLLLTSCVPKPSEETVTVKTSRHPTVSAELPRISTSPLPVRDPNLEKAGDLIAEATVHLHQRQSASALHALSLADAEIKRALYKTAQDESTHDELLSILAELETVREAIHRGMFEDAIRRLSSLNRKLDSID